MISLLYVDDEPALLELGKLFLEEHGEFLVDTVESGQSALAMLGSKKYDAIISDYQMPVMDGIDLLKTIRKQSTIPFILFTGRGREEVVIEAINSGATFYLQKGGDPTAQFTELSHKIRLAVERARTGIALKEKTEEIDNFFAASINLLCITDTSGNFRHLNPAWERLLGYPERDLLGKNVFDLIHPDDLPAMHDAFAILLTQKAVENFVNRIRCRDGSYRWIEWQAHPACNLIYAAVHDITDKKLAVDAIRAAEEKFSTIFRQSPDMIWISELESGRFVDVNDAADRILGYPREELIGGTSIEFGMWVDVRDRARLIQRIRRDGRVDRFEILLRRKEGKTFNASIAASTIILGGLEYLIVTVRDISAMIKADNALRESEEKYRTVIDTANEAILIVQDGIQVFANNSASRLFGMPAEDLMGKQVSGFIWPEDRQYVMEMHRQRIAGEKVPDTYDFRILGAGGKPRWILTSAAKILWQGRLATLCLMTDITARKQAEAALVQAEEKFSTIYLQSPDIIWISELESGRFVDANDASERITGYTREEQIGKTSLDLGIWACPEDRATLIQTVREKGRIDWFETRHKRKNGEIFEVESSASTIRLEGKEYLITSVRDISQLKRTEERLRESEEKYRTLIEKANEAIIIIQDRRLVFANPSAAKLFGVPVEDLAGKPLAGFVWPEDRKLVSAKYRKRIASENIPDAYDFRIVDSDHTIHWISLSGAAIQWQGRPAVLSLMTDITGRWQAEHSVREANKKLSLLSGITRHDIKNQMLILQGYLAILEQKQPDPAFSEYFRKIHAASERISSMIQFTKEYEEIGVAAPTWQDIRALVDTVANQAPIGKVRVENRIPAGTEAFSDPLIARVIYNLMDNAARYGGKITTIRFFLQSDGDRCRIICEDDGAGIPLNEKDLIFERGFGRNTGMGLYLSREVLGITGISIREIGEPGTGARFEISVPPGAYRRAGTQEPVSALLKEKGNISQK